MGDTVGAVEDKILTLERENFDLKMKVYYYQNKMTAESTNSGLESPKVSVNQQHVNEIAQLKETIRILRCQVSDLQADNMQLRLRLTAASTQNIGESMGMSSAATNATVQMELEENRRKDKEVTTMLLKHDEQVIDQLKEEISVLRKKHSQDAEIVGECAERTAALSESLTEKETVIANLHDKCHGLQKQVDMLKDQLRRQDLLLVKKYSDEEKLAYGIHGTNFNTTTSLTSNIRPDPGGASKNPLDHSIRLPGSTFTSPSKPTAVLSPASTMKQSKLESLLFNQSPNRVSEADPSIPSSPLQTLGDHSTELMLAPHGGQLMDIATGVGSPDAQNKFAGFSAQTAWEELHQLRKEKALLIKKLQENQLKLMTTVEEHEKENKLQEDTIELAAEEVDRLEKALARMTKKFEKAQGRYRDADQALEALRVRVTELQTQRDELFLKKDLDTALQLSIHRAEQTRSRTQRRSSMAAGTPGAGSATPSSSNAKATRRLSIGSSVVDFRESVSPMNSLRSPAAASSAGGGPVSDMGDTVPLQVHTATVETYKKRESELLQALEGVVKRCQELEGLNKTLAGNRHHSATH